MDKTALNALRGSIKKWEKIIACTEVDRGPDNCPLCLEYNTVGKDSFDCVGCPVFKKIGQEYCEGTPYRVFYDHHHNFHRTGLVFFASILCGECLKFATDELNFLKSLLPKKDKKHGKK